MYARHCYFSPKYSRAVRKSTWAPVWAVSRTNHIYTEYYFNLTKRQIDKLWLLRFDIFWTAFTADDKIWAFSFWILERVCAIVSMTALWAWHNDEVTGDAGWNVVFWLLIMQYVNICLSQWTHIFQMINTWYYKIIYR